MAESEGFIGYGTLLQRGSLDVVPIYTTVAEVTAVTPGAADADDVEFTHMESPNGRKEFKAGMTDPGTMNFTVNFLPSNITHDSLTGFIADQVARTIRPWRVVYPNGKIWTCDGYAKSYAPKIETKGAVTADVSVRLTGAEAWS